MIKYYKMLNKQHKMKEISYKNCSYNYSYYRTERRFK